MKRVWLIERTDSAGEFQPMSSEVPHLSKPTAVARIEQLVIGRVGSPRYRVMQYVRMENKT